LAEPARFSLEDIRRDLQDRPGPGGTE
jgi:hypothetical protein